MKITIKTMSGKQIALEVEESTTVSRKRIPKVFSDHLSQANDRS
jgi:hypothetical protein